MNDSRPRHLTLWLTDRGVWHQQAALAAAPPELEVMIRRHPAPAELLTWLLQVEFLISERTGVIDAALIQAAPRLRLIQRLGSLTYDIDLDAARAAGIPVCATPVPGCVLVAEHLLLQLLALAKRLREVEAIALAAGEWGPSRRTDEDTFAYNWSNRQGITGLAGKTFGILGFGEIGAELARRLRPFGPAAILYHKRRRLPAAAETALGIIYATPETLAAESDGLVVLLPYAPENDLALNAAFLARLKPTAWLVSCGSGSVIDEAALAAALRAGRLAGAALDTFEWEPLRPDNPLLPLARDPYANVLLTPHTAAGSPDVTGATRGEDYANLLRWLRGEPLRDRVA